MRLLPSVFSTLCVACSGFAQTYTISTFAGGGLPVNKPGASASLGRVTAVAFDPTGNVILASPVYNVVLRLNITTGALTLLAGNGTRGFSGDNGPATSAQVAAPYGVAVDSAGNVYIADLLNNRIRKVSNGVITTVAGNGIQGFSGDNGPATSAQLAAPDGVAVDFAGNLFIVDSRNSRIRKVSNGVITTIAGNGTPVFSGDNGPATSAQLQPAGIAVDSAGNVYIADLLNSRIRKVSNGLITTVAGNGTPGLSGDNGPATSAQVKQPSSVAVDSAGSLYIADRENDRIRMVSNGVITTVAGTFLGFSGDNGPATSAQVNQPTSVAVDPTGNLYIADSGNNRVRKVSNGVITTVAGNGTEGLSGDGGPATSAQLELPRDLAVDSTGNLYIADPINSSIRKVSNGVITTLATVFSSDGVAVDSVGNLYVSDIRGSVVRKVSNGAITTVAGNGTRGFSGDNGPATSAQLAAPKKLAVDSVGNLYISDSEGARVRRVSNGVITTVAGNGLQGFSGDNAAATSASLRNIEGIAVDSAGNIYIADSLNHRIRKVSNGVITTVAGNGAGDFSGDNGPATSAQLQDPQGVAVDSAGNLYIADHFSRRVRKVSNGVITTIAGGGASFGDNGPATSAELTDPVGVAVDSAGNVYIADQTNQRVRVLRPTGSACSYNVTPASLQASVSGGNLTIAIQTSPFCSWTISNLPSWIAVTGAASGTGSASVTLAAAANVGGARNATISIAGVSVMVTQTAPSGCIYAINPGGHAFAAAGGNGTINITAAPGCSWAAGSTLSWVTVNGAVSGTGNGIVTYQVAANSGAARSGNLMIAGLSFIVEEASASIAGFTNAGSMAQLASAGHWTTTITLVNTGTASAQARLNFFDDNGNPLTLPLNFPQSPSAGPLLASTLDRTLNAGAALVIETTGPDSAPTQVGWAQLLSNGTVGGFAVFRQAIGSTSQEALVPLENRNAGGYVLFFDNTNVAATGVALANVTTQAVNLTITIRDDSGAVVLSETIALPASSHLSFNLADRYASLTAQKQGTAEFRTPSSGQISLLGLRFNGTGAFTTIPALAK